MASRKQDGSEGIDRRAFLGSALIAAAGGLVPRGVGADSELGAPSVNTPFKVTLNAGGGLLALDRKTQRVELAYPGATTGSCMSPAHPMRLELKGAAIVKVTGNLKKVSPWLLSQYTVRVEVPGSTTKPKLDRWRLEPNALYPHTEAEYADLDWIPTIDAKAATGWSNLPLARLVFPTGEWIARKPKLAKTFERQLWDLRASGKTFRTQYVTDVVSWSDESDGEPVILHFDKDNKEVGSISIEPKPGSMMELNVTTTAPLSNVGVGESAEHYCMYFSLLESPKEFEIVRTDQIFSLDALEAKKGKAIPGKFCPGGKVIFG